MRKLLLCILALCSVAWGETVNSNIIPSQEGLDLGRQGQRWDGFFRNVDLSGTISGNFHIQNQSQYFDLKTGQTVFNPANGYIRYYVNSGNRLTCITALGALCDVQFNSLTGREIAPPTNPAVGFQIGYFKSGVGWCSKDSNGIEYCPGSGGGGGSMANSIALQNTSVTAPTPTASNPCPTGQNVVEWMQQSGGNYRPYASIDASTVAPPDTPAGTLNICWRTWFNNSGSATPAGSNNFVNIYDVAGNGGTGATPGQQHASLGVFQRVTNQTGIAQHPAVYGEQIIKGTTTCTSIPFGEVCGAGLRGTMSAENTNTIAGAMAGVVGFAERNDSSAQFSSCGAGGCLSAVSGYFANQVSGTASSAIFSSFFAGAGDFSGTPCTNCSYAAYIASTPTTARFATGNFGMLIKDFGSNAADYNIRSDGTISTGYNTFSGPLCIFNSTICHANAGFMLDIGHTVLFNDSGYQDFKLIAAPSNPSATFVRMFANTSTGNIECLTSAGASCFASGGGAGNVSNSGTPTANQIAQWTDATHIQGLATTGTGNAVLASSPTIVTPTIASFTNSTHNHTNAAGGGQLTDAALSAPVTAAKGGTGVDSSGSTGIPKVSAGTWTFNAGVQQLAPSTSADLAGVITNETGSGALVFNDTPTFLTPNFASFVNAQHNHTNAAGGGQLTGSSMTSFDISGLAASSAFQPPASTSAAPTISGVVAFNSTVKQLVAGNGSTTEKYTYFTGTTPTVGNCVNWGTNGALGDVGAPCGSGGGGSISGSGTTNFLPKFSAPTVLTNSCLSDDGTTATNSCSGGFIAGSASSDGGVELPSNTTLSVSSANRVRIIANSNIFKVSENAGSFVEVAKVNSSITGNAATASALAATPTPCSAGNGARGVAANGDSVNCTNFMEEPSGNGIVVRTGVDNSINRAIAGTSNRITLSNGDGVSGNPTIDLGVNVHTSTSAADFIQASFSCTDVGSTDAYACTSTPAITAYTTNVLYVVKVPTANTGGATANLSGLGAKTIVKYQGGVAQALATNDIQAGAIIVLGYDGTNLQLLSTLGNTSGGGSGDITDVGDCTTGACFNALNTGTTLTLSNATSGTVALKTVTGALGTVTVSLPAATDTLVGKATTDTLTNKTFDTAGAGNSLSINGVAATANTGTGSVVRATSPTLVTPVLGVATITSINKMAVTAPATSSTLAVADGKTLTASNTLTLAGTDGTTETFQATGTVMNRDSTDTMTNKTYDVEGTGNVFTDVSKMPLKMAVCQNTTATLLWDTPTTNPAVAACNTGTNTQKATADFADGGVTLSVQTSFMLPTDWTGNVDIRGKWFTSATTGNVVWQVATICVADSETSDPAYNTASTITEAAKGTTLQDNDFTISAITTTGCAAGEEMYLKIFRDPTNGSDTLAATASLREVELTLRRAK